MGAERGRRTYHRTQVARIGDAVQGGDQRRWTGVGGAGEQVVGMRVVVGADPECQALVQRAAGEPVEFGGAGLEHGHAAVGGELDGLADPLVVLPARTQTYKAAEGTPARSDSTTGLRPATNSAASPAPRGARAGGPDEVNEGEGVGRSSWRRPQEPPEVAAARRCAGWPGRMTAGGVGPFPSRARLP